MAEGTGRRISAWRNLVWEDVNFEAGTIHWRAEHDKKGYEQVVVMSDAVRDALAAERKAQAAIGRTAVFPSPKDPTKPCNRHLFDDWLRRAYKLAKIVPQRRGMWHSIRRKWATERKGYPVKDVAAAGGWKTEEVLVTSYQQADAETINTPRGISNVLMGCGRVPVVRFPIVAAACPTFSAPRPTAPARPWPRPRRA